MGWPKGEASIAPKSLPAQAARTAFKKKPMIQQHPTEATVPIGTAFLGLLASSLIWTQESNAPIVQIGHSQDSMNAQPVGQVVPSLAIWPNTVPAELIGTPLMRILTGKAITVAIISAMLAMTNQVWRWCMTLAQKVASRPWQSTVATKMAYKYPRWGDHSPSLLILPRDTINDANPSRLPSAKAVTYIKGSIIYNLWSKCLQLVPKCCCIRQESLKDFWIVQKQNDASTSTNHQMLATRSQVRPI